MPHPSQSPITDPERMRALAHPVRLDLLDFLGQTEEATATQCAEHLGESVASCSFHLRMLEKYGFIERAEQRGREKPWRVVQSSWEVRPSPDQPGSAVAVAEVGTMHLLRETERVQRWLATVSAESDAWLNASTLSSSSLWLTHTEAAELSRELQELGARFTGRAENPQSRPEGARLVRIFGTLNPEPTTDQP